MGRGFRETASIIALAAAVALAGCGADDAGLAAKYDGGSITEDEVTEYTAEFRESRSYDTPEIWAQHLFENDLTTKTWREQAIGAIVEERLQLTRAAELGIQPDEERIESQIASDKEGAGVDADDEEAWSSYLESRGTTPGEYREDLEKASLESQLLGQEVQLDVQRDDELIADYMEENLLDRVVRRYRALSFDTQEAAQAAIDDMAGLSGDALAERFAYWVEHDDSDGTTADNGGDIGWDIASDLGSVQQELNEEMVPVGGLSQQVHESDGAFYVLLCADRYVFVRDEGYDEMPDDDLRQFLLTATTYANWSRMTSDYIAELREAAHVQVREMPAGLPYDVDDLIAGLQQKADAARAQASAAGSSDASDAPDASGADAASSADASNTADAFGAGSSASSSTASDQDE